MTELENRSAGGTRLDNIQNKSDDFWSDVADDVSQARVKARENLAWAKSRVMVNSDTGEIVTDKEGNVLTLEHMTKSWYSEKGGRNNAHGIVKRWKKAVNFPADVKIFRPKMVTLTFGGSAKDSWLAERAIQKFLDAVRHFAKRQGLKNTAYYWSAEPQMKTGRGALHYHVLLLGFPFISKAQLQAWWSHGFVDIRAVDDYGRAFKYLAKYLWKWGHLAGNPDDLPDWWFLFSVFSKRRYGFSKWFQLSAIERIPRWIRNELDEIGFLDLLRKASRAVGGGWRLEFVDDDVGETSGYVVRSPFTIVEWGA